MPWEPPVPFRPIPRISHNPERKHRGSLRFTYYVHRMYVHRIQRPPRAGATSRNIFSFELHYALAKTYVQEVVLFNAHVPTIDGFQCPTVEKDAEQNALFKALVFTPWSCTDPVQCGSVMNFCHFLSNANSPAEITGDASQLAASSSGHAFQLAALSSSSSAVCVP